MQINAARPDTRRNLGRLFVLSALILTLIALSGCSRFGLGRLSGQGARVEVEGTRFRARLESDRETRRDFSVVVRPAIVDIEGAQEAGRFEANKYCIRNFGSSDIAWNVGPDLPIEEVSVIEDTISMSGRCTQR